MTSSDQASTRDMEPFDSRIEILARELELAIKWRRPCLLLVVYGSEYVRADVQTALTNQLVDLGQRTASLKLKDQLGADLPRYLREFRDPAGTVLFVEGLRCGNARQAAAYAALNYQREILVEKHVRMILWLTPNEIMELARNAPDFWSHRHRVIEFTESPKAEQVMQGAVDSAWQGVGEYAGQYDDTDAKITLRESLLTELPSEAESSSTRANLQLTLGILNWRKGEYEKADELLQEALRIGSLMQDSWFEAECFNAIALVKTSMDRTDEAIDAYKHAIQLAPDQIFAWNNLGNLCARIDRNDEAIVVFLKAIECNPEDPIGWNGLANVYYKIGYVDDAIAAYRRSIQFMPTFAHPWNGLGDVYASVGRSEEAIKAYRKAIELNKHYALPWLRLGSLFNKQERHREAIKAYQQALRLDPKKAAVWNELGTIHLKSDSYAEAAEAFSKAVEHDRGHAAAYTNLAHTYVQQGMYEEALPLYLKSIDLLSEEKDKAAAYNRLGDVYRQLNDYDNAVASYQAADRHAPAESASKSRIQAGMARLAAVTGEPSDPPAAVESELPEVRAGEEVEAMAPEPMDAPYWIFNPPSNSHIEISSESASEPIGDAMSTPTTPVNSRAKKESAPHKDSAEGLEQVKDDNVNPLVWNEKGNVHFRQQSFDDAISAYNRAIQLDPTFGWPYSNLALTYLIQGQYAEAILLYQRSVELMKVDVDKAVSWNGLGNVYRALNDYPNAVAAYQKASELDPETAGMRDGADSFQVGEQAKTTQMWNDLGELFFKTGDYDQAATAFNNAIELEPGSGHAYNNLAYVLASRGDYEPAIPYYRKSLELLHEKADQALVWNRLGNAYRKLNDYDNAMKAYQQAVKLSDDGPSLVERTRFSLLSNVYVEQ